MSEKPSVEGPGDGASARRSPDDITVPLAVVAVGLVLAALLVTFVIGFALHSDSKTQIGPDVQATETGSDITYNNALTVQCAGPLGPAPTIDTVSGSQYASSRDRVSGEIPKDVDGDAVMTQTCSIVRSHRLAHAMWWMLIPAALLVAAGRFATRRRVRLRGHSARGE